MSQLAPIPTSAPFSAVEINALNTVVGRSSPEQRAWLSGYLAGLAAAVPQPQPAAVPPPSRSPASRPPPAWTAT